MAAISSLTTRSGKPRALSGAATRMLGHDVDGEPTRIGDSLRTVSEGDAHGAAGTFRAETGVKRTERGDLRLCLAQRYATQLASDGADR